jgi:hypothetical protein
MLTKVRLVHLAYTLVRLRCEIATIKLGDAFALNVHYGIFPAQDRYEDCVRRVCPPAVTNR